MNRIAPLDPNLKIIHAQINKKSFKLISKLYQLLFIVINIIFSLDFGYVKHNSKIVKFSMISFHIIKISVILLIVFKFCGIHYNHHILVILWFLNTTVQYLTCTFVSQFSQKDNSVFAFHKNLIPIDTKLGVPGSVYNIEFKFTVSCLSVLCYEASAIFYFCSFFAEYCLAPAVFIVPFNVPILSADIVLVVYTFLFHSVYCRMLNLTNLVSNCTQNFNFYCDVYEKLADVLDKGKSKFSCMFFWILMSYVSDLMLRVFYPLAQLSSEISIFYQISAIIAVIPSLLLVLAPVYAATKLSSQVQTMKLMLFNKLINDKDKEHYPDMQRFIDYIEARPFKYNIASIIPLDYSLVAIVLNVIITYVIVLMQITPNG